MNDHQIHCFLEAAYEKNFTRAAQKLNMTQPAISRIIVSLEKELNAPLFIRTNNKRIYLTPAGEVYFEFFKKTQLEFQIKKELADKLASQKHFIMHCGYVAGWNIYPQLITVFQQVNITYPDIQFSLECEKFKELNHSLASHDLDIILTLKNSLTTDIGIQSIDVLELKRIIIFSDNFTKNPKAFVTPYDFKDAIFYYATDSHPNINLEIENFCKPYGFVPNLKPVRNVETVITMVESGSGVSILDYWGYSNIKGLHYVILNSCNTVSLAWHNSIPNDIIKSICLNIKSNLPTA